MATPNGGWAQGREVKIAAGELAQSLEELSRQLGIQILYDADRLRGMKSPSISGPLTARDALGQMLKGTTLTVQGGDDSFLIVDEPSTPSPVPRDSGKTRGPIQLDEVAVTGTHIRDEVPVGASLSTYGRDEFETLGIASLDSLGRTMLDNFSGADSLASLNTNGNVGILQQGAASNLFGGGSFDLLGLGPGATLTLLDGHRIAPGGLDGSMVDVSLIPLSAIDHVEVLTDGASAIYGSDAVAGVVNIVTRRALEGAETSIRYGQSTEGGAGEFTTSQLLGHAWSSGNVLFDFEYDNNQGLDAAERSWIGPENGPYSLIPENHRHSLFVNLTQSLDETALSIEGLYSSREFRMSGLQFNPGGVVPDSEIGGGHANLVWTSITGDRDLTSAWHVSSTAMYSSMNQWRSADEYPDGLAGNDFGNVLLADSDLASLDISASGRVLRLPGGALRLALGGGLRSDIFRGSVLSIEPLPTFSGSQTDLNAYGEATVPIVGEDFSFPGVRRLEVSLAYRVDRYSHIGAPSNTKWGWNWEPTPGFTVRGTQGTSFKAPLISQLDAPTTSYTTLVPAMAGGTAIDTLVMTGGSQSLRPERSRSLTAGIDWAPIGWPQFRGSMTYFNISYDDRIQSLNINATLLEEQLPGSALTFYDSSYILPFFQAPGFQQDGAGLGPSGVNAIIDNQLSNAEKTVEQGIRIDGQYMHDGGGLGRWRLSFSGNYSRLDGTASEALLPLFAGVANTIAEPPRLRMRAGATWQFHALTADFEINHSGAYKNTLFSPTEGIGSWTTEDLTLQAKIPDHANGLWHDFSLVLNVQNLADRRPPFLAIPAGDIAVGRSAVPFDGTNASAVGRYVSVEVRKAW